MQDHSFLESPWQSTPGYTNVRRSAVLDPSRLSVMNLGLSHVLVDVTFSFPSLPCFEVQGAVEGHLTHAVLIPFPVGQTSQTQLMQPSPQESCRKHLPSPTGVAFRGRSLQRARDVLGILFIYLFNIFIEFNSEIPERPLSLILLRAGVVAPGSCTAPSTGCPPLPWN